jgi:hypothetical protein
MRSLIKTIVVPVATLCACALPAAGVEMRSVDRYGRSVQLDGFLLEWNTDGARPLSPDSQWMYDVLNTREGLTGYFFSPRRGDCGLWKFRFLPHGLSTYSSMEMQASLDSLRPFYRTAPISSGADAGIVAEWVIPWDSIWRDSAGSYRVGIFAFDTCGDTLQPLILTGRMHRQAPAPWDGVYSKAAILAVMMLILFWFQRKIRKKINVRRHKPPLDDATGSSND